MIIKEKYSQRIKETTVGISMSKVSSVKRSDLRCTGLRVYSNGLIGVAGSMGEYEENKLFDLAKDHLALKIPYPYKLSSRYQEMQHCPANVIPETKLRSEIQNVIDFFISRYPNYIFSNNVRLVKRWFELNNDLGLDLSYSDEFISVGISFTEKTKMGIPEGAISYLGREFRKDEFLNWGLMLCEVFNEKADFLTSGYYPIIFSTSDRVPIMKLIQDLNGYRFGSGNSLLANKRGKKIFSDKLTIYQTLNPTDVIAPFFDAEGVVNSHYRYTLIDKGTVITPYTDKKTAHNFNLPLTGSSYADYDSVPGLQCLGFILKPSNLTIKELLGGQPGIYVFSVGGSNFTPDGNFAATIDIAYLFDGKRLVGRLPKFQVKSNLFDMFGSGFIGVSKNTVAPFSNAKYLALEMNISKY